MISLYALGALAGGTFIAAVVLFFFLRGGGKTGGTAEKNGKNGRYRRRKFPFGPPATGKRGEAHVCPLCAVVFAHGEVVHSKVFPATSAAGRLLHITGCVYCYDGARERLCPVCGAHVAPDEYLIGRIYERPGRSHVKITGCVHCAS